MKERIKELEKILEKVCEKYDDNCGKCPYKKECDEYSKIETKKETLTINDKIKVYIYSSGKEIKTRNFDRIFTVYKKDGKLGINWNIERNPASKGDIFTPFETFVDTVIFENVRTGEKFHFNNIKNEIEKMP